MFRSKLSEINRKSFWGAVIGAGAGLLSGILQSKDADRKAKDAWEREKSASAMQFERSYGAYKTRYQDTMADMRQAGLNPILAASGGFNVGQSVQAQKASAPMAQAPSYEFASGAKDITQSGLNIAETKKKLVEIKKVRAETLKTIAQTYVERAKKGLIKAQERELIKRVVKMEQEIWQIIQDTNKKFVEGLKVEDEIKLIQKKTAALKMQMARLSKMENVYTGPFGSLISYINQLLTITMRVK